MIEYNIQIAYYVGAIMSGIIIVTAYLFLRNKV